MVVYFFFGVLLLAGLYVLSRWFIQAKPGDVAKALKAVAFVLLVAVGLFLVVTGRFGYLFMLAPALLPWILRARGVRNMYKAAQGPTSGQSSSVETASLAMELDLESGEMDGTVLSGPFEGRILSDLDAILLQDLYRWMAAEDPEGARLLEAYMDRTLGAEWREAAGASTHDHGDHQAPPPGEGAMSREEAHRVLGLEPGADADAIREAYRRLMLHAHPDKGGSPYLAAKINAAKDLLLNEGANPSGVD